MAGFRLGSWPCFPFIVLTQLFCVDRHGTRLSETKLGPAVCEPLAFFIYLRLALYRRTVVPLDRRSKL